MQCLFLSHPQPRDNPDYLHRVAWPGKALSEHMEVIAIQMTHPDAIKLALQADLLVIYMVADQLMLPIIEQRKQKHLKTIYEISDDFADFPSTLSMYEFYKHQPNQDLIREIARNCDALQFTSPFLQQKYQELNAITQVFRNQLPSLKYSLDELLKSHNTNSITNEKISLGWAGALGHYEDAKLLAQALKEWPHIDQVDLKIMAKEKIVSLFTDLDLSISSTESANMDSYLTFLKDLDIGVIMLSDNDFNQARSDGKYIEFASCGVIPVCANVGSFKDAFVDGESGLLFNNHQELYEILDELLDSSSLRNKIQKGAWEEVSLHRVHQPAAKERSDFYHKIAQINPDKTVEQKQTIILNGYVEAIDACEAVLLSALEEHAKSNYKDALALYQRVLERAPDFYLTWLRLGELHQAIGLDEDANNYINNAIHKLQDVLVI